MTREEFEIYVDHFNNKRFDDVLSYFADDVEVQYFSPLKKGAYEQRIFYGKDAFRERYEILHKTLREVMKLGKFVCDGDNIFVELWTEFHAFEDSPNFSVGHLKVGDVAIANNFVLYWLNEEGKFKKIRIAHHRIHDASEAFL